MTMSWSGTLQRTLAGLPGEMNSNLANSLKPAADSTVEYARANRPWIDRTGAARRGLYADIDVTQRGVTLTVGHGVSYGKDLEKRGFGILAPAMRYLEARIASDASLFR